MGDLVLTQDEIAPVMSRLQQGGIEQTALHHHLLRETPRVMDLHVQGHGDPVKLAKSIHAALALSKTPLGPASPGTPTPISEIDTHQLDQIIGARGSANGGVYQFGILRAAKIIDGGMEVPPSLGTAIALNLQPTGDGKAATTGDFVLIPGKLGHPGSASQRHRGHRHPPPRARRPAAPDLPPLLGERRRHAARPRSPVCARRGQRGPAQRLDEI